MSDELVKEEQRRFFKENQSGCAFAAYAAKKPSKYGWRSVVLDPDTKLIQSTLCEAIHDNDVQALSLIFPSVTNRDTLIDLVRSCTDTELIYDEGSVQDGLQFIRLRALVRQEVSWVTGFGPFDFLPRTRRAPHTEITIRVTERPNYAWHFKPPIDGVIHLADLSMAGLSDRRLKKLWSASFKTTEKILGHKPDDESAAKTTFVIPTLD